MYRCTYVRTYVAHCVHMYLLSTSTVNLWEYYFQLYFQLQISLLPKVTAPVKAVVGVAVGVVAIAALTGAGYLIYHRLQS